MLNVEFPTFHLAGSQNLVSDGSYDLVQKGTYLTGGPESFAYTYTPVREPASLTILAWAAPFSPPAGARGSAEARPLDRLPVPAYL